MNMILSAAISCPEQRISTLVRKRARLQIHHHHHQSLNREGRWGTTDDFATSFLHFSLFSTALWDLPNSRPVRSLMLSSHLFLCPPCLLPPFTVPCKMVTDHCLLKNPENSGRFTEHHRKKEGGKMYVMSHTFASTNSFDAHIKYFISDFCAKEKIEVA